MEEMLRRGLSLGGEQSGHVIFADYLFTGDGLATALSVLRVMAAQRPHAGGPGIGDDRVSAGADEPAREGEGGPEHRPAVAAVLQSVESRLEGSGRLLVRYSGTEPLLRVMLEGQDQGEIRRWGQEIIDAVKLHVGAADRVDAQGSGLKAHAALALGAVAEQASSSVDVLSSDP